MGIKLLKILFLSLALFYAVIGFSQIEIKANLSPEDNKLYEKSLALFNERQYLDAHRGFSQLLSLHPRETGFKFYFGVCIIQLRQDLEKGINYLEETARGGIYESYFHIGTAHHYLYDFSNAIRYYNRFKSNAKAKEIRDMDVDRYIAMAESGKELIRYAYELKVVNYRELGIRNFHYSYDFSDFGGRIIIKPESFRTRADRSIKEPDLMYISDRHNVIYMSSYGSRRGESLNIYKVERDGDEWGEPQILPSPVNDEYDQAYPFIAADGITLYFASKGHNSMGGYDIFKSLYSPSSKSWSKPENLDFPINTPFDDIMFVTDIYNETAFFSSNRKTQDDRLAIYRILLEKDPPKRLISSLDDAHKQARLEVDIKAIEELEKREIQRMAMLTDGEREEEFEEPLIPIERREETIHTIQQQEKELLISEYFDETTKIIRHYEHELDEDIKKIDNLITQKDDLSKIIAEKELDFDRTTDENKRLKILKELNTAKKELDNTETYLSEIISDYSSDEIIIIKPEDFNDLKKKGENYKEVQKIIIGSDSLVNHIVEIREKIETLKQEEFAEKKVEKQYLEILEQELSKKLSDNIELISDFVEKQEKVESGEILAVIQKEITGDQTYVNIYEDELVKKQADVKKQYSEILELQETIESSDNEKRKSRAEARLNEILPEAQTTHLDYLDSKIMSETVKIEIYDKFLKEYEKNIPSEAIVLKEKAEVYQEKAESLRNRAETTEDPTEKIELLTEAEKNIELASLHYETIFDIAANKTALSDVPEITVKEESAELHTITKKVIAQSTKPATEELVINIEQINNLLTEAKEIEEEINKYIDEFDAVLTSDKTSAVSKIDSLNKSLLTKVVDANKLIVENQRKEIQDNFEKGNIDYDEYKEQIDNYIKNAEEAIRDNNYYMLSEVIIQGESILKDKDSKTAEQIKSSHFDGDIALLYEKSESASSWITENVETDIIEPEPEPSEIEKEIKTTYTSFDSVLTTELNETEEEIEQIKIKISSTVDDRERQVLRNELDNLTGNQRNKIIEVSDSKSKVFEELFEITQSEYPDKEDDIYLTYKELHDELLSIRSTIVDFNEFHDTETLSELNKSASTLEVEIISHIGKMFEETQIEPVIARLSDEFIEKEPETEILITIQEQIEKQDDEVVSNFIKLEENKEMLVVKKSETLEEIENLQSELETTTERRQQRRIETELERLEKEYIVQIKELARTELKILDIKYDIATSTYDTMEPSTEVAHRISDSLRLQSVSEIEQSKMHYEYILSYREEELTPELQENLEMALRHSESGLNHIEKSINVKYSDALIEPAAIAYIDERPEEITVVYESSEEVIEHKEEKIAEIIIPEKPEITERELPVYIQDETPRYVAEERQEQFAEKLIIIPDSRESVYSDENPIREITEIPPGLSYRIQIGAFRRHVPNETFKGISPILVEDILGSRWLRYVVGLFYSFENANLSLPMVRALGFHDCFIVAYYNDERIPLYRAREIENQLIASGERIREDVRTGETGTTPADLQTVHQDITKTDDIFFCVQIGVYRELVSSARLYGLSPISYDRLANGLIRHFYGKFMNYNAAINEQNRIRRLGISDAFVVAYNNGRRINVSEARESLQVYEAIVEPEIADRVTEVRPEEVRPAETIIDDKPVYFVQIGAYRRSVIPQTRQLFENIAGNNTIYEITDESTLIIYRIGRFSSYQNALEIQNAARNNGIGDAFIIAVVNGQRISVSEARRRE